MATPMSSNGFVPDSQPDGARTPSSARLAGGASPHTPLSLPRSELGSSFHARGMHSHSSRSPGRGASQADSASEAVEAVIWGTDINLQRAMDAFRTFLREYHAPGSSDSEAHYVRLLADVADSQVYNLNIDARSLFEFAATRKLYSQLIRYPGEIIPAMDVVVNEEFSRLFPDIDPLSRRIQVRVYNLREVKHMRDLGPGDIEQLVAVRGMVTRVTGVIPDMKQGFFRCRACGHNATVDIDRGRIDEPSTCVECKASHSYELVHNRSLFTDRQHVKMQETPEAIPEGETPQTINLCAFDDLVDVARPGDRIEVTGVFRVVGTRVNPRKRTTRAVFNTYLDILHIRKTDKTRLMAEDPTALPESEFYATFDASSEADASVTARRRKFEEMSRDPQVYEKLAASMAPSIWELDDVKKGLLCQLFGGVNKQLGKQGKFRGEINVLMCGDPGTSKSQLLGYVHKIAPRGIYTSGKGSSAVGLTAYVTKDPDTRELVLESGALVLSDRGICCIDEFDKMNDSTRSILHEVMEQQTVSIAKAGIICTLNARTSVVACANPVESRYNPSRSVVDNIQLPPTLLSRFDLIYLILDKPNADTDRRLATHLVSLYHETPTLPAATYNLQTLTEYISYARAHINPVISDDAMQALVDGYKTMRDLGRGPGGKKVITATPRQLESLIRLSEARARVRFSETVTRADVVEAIRLMNVATQTAATDPLTGTIDMDMISTGRTAAARDSVTELVNALRELVTTRKTTVEHLTRQLSSQMGVPVRTEDVQVALKQLADDGVIKFTGLTAVKAPTHADS